MRPTPSSIASGRELDPDTVVGCAVSFICSRASVGLGLERHDDLVADAFGGGFAESPFEATTLAPSATSL